MPASERSLRLTDAYRARLIALRDRTTRLATAGWSRVAVEDLDGTHSQWLAATVGQIEAAQRTGVALTAGYLAAYVALERHEPPEAPRPIQTDAVGASQDGRPLAAALAASLITVKVALKERREAAEALELGKQRAVRLTSEATAAAPREALYSAMEADARIVGWRRVLEGASSCGACMASADGRVRTPSERLKIHAFCDCTAEPVVAEAADTVRRPTGREIFDGLTVDLQDVLLGKEKADLIRSGLVPFERLIQPQPMAIAPDGITERPLGDLQSPTSPLGASSE